jgi:Xaa-Pro dipeptidase
LINQCRSIKNKDEITNARTASKIADIGMRVAITRLAAGDSEQDASITSMREMNAFWVAKYPDVKVCTFGSLEGGQHDGLEAWVLSGSRKFLNCDAPTARKPETGETISVFVWTVANGMRAELERTVRVGTVAAVEREAIEAICEIREEVEKLIKPGTPTNTLYEVARRGLEARGYGDYLPGRIGHAIGLPGVCATQFSDMVLITTDGHEYLTSPHCDGDLEINPPVVF